MSNLTKNLNKPVLQLASLLGKINNFLTLSYFVVITLQIQILMLILVIQNGVHHIYCTRQLVT